MCDKCGQRFPQEAEDEDAPMHSSGEVEGNVGNSEMKRYQKMHHLYKQLVQIVHDFKGTYNSMNDEFVGDMPRFHQMFRPDSMDNGSNEDYDDFIDTLIANHQKNTDELKHSGRNAYASSSKKTMYLLLVRQ